MKAFLKLQRAERLKKIKPPTTGIFVLTRDQTGRLIYVEKKFPNPPVIHQQAPVIEKSIESYFANKERYLRNGKSGTKRILLFGIPGGGKTTLCYQIARKYAKTHLVVFCNDLSELAMHSEECARHSIPTIVFNEECDRWMGNHQGWPTVGEAKDNVKAFLDGHLAARNKGGELNILITNYPDKIEKTILFRPGRIHERIEIGTLDPEHAVRVACHYFVDYNNKLICDEKELEYFRSNNFTGAQIENIAGMVIDYVNGTDTIITKEAINEVVTKFKEAVNTVKNYKDPQSLIDTVEPAVGFFAPPEKIVADDVSEGE
jgi:ATP-dependent 26S proteasome regulatory subunit